MAFPNDAGTLPANMQGTTSTADATLDHALMHRELGTVINALSAKMGIPAGTPAANQILVGSGLGTTAWGQTWNGGTIGSAVIGTPSITAGTLAGQIQNNGTIANGVYGTALIQGGTANNQVVGTPAITGGTLSTLNINQGTYGTVTGSGDLVSLAQAGSVMTGQYRRQGGSSTDYTIAGTSNFNETGVFLQFGAIAQTGVGTPAAGGTVIFPTAYSENPFVVLTSLVAGGNALIPGLNTISTTQFTFNDERTAGTVMWLAIGKR